jgi:twinkle protein
MNCPFCDDREKKFAISLTDGAFNCLHLNSCGARGSFWDLQQKLGDTPQRLDGDKLFIRPAQAPAVFVKPTVKAADLTPEALAFLSGRKITQATAERFGLKSTPDGLAIMFPYFKGADIVAAKYRTINGKKFWNEEKTEPVLFNRDRCTGDCLIIVEGEMDCLALYEYGHEGVSVPNGTGDERWIENEWEYLEQFQTIYLCLDQDTAGQKETMKLVERLGRWRCRAIKLPHKDVNECLIRGVNETDFYACITNSVEYPPALLQNAADFEDEVLKLFKNDTIINGTTTFCYGLNGILRGWRTQELTIWSGKNGSGKSTIINQEVLHLIGLEHRVCLASLEMPPARYLRWAIMQAAKVKDRSEVLIKQTLSDWKKYFFIVNTHDEINPDTLFDVFEYAARRYGVEHFIVDSMARVVLGGRDELSDQRQFVSRFLSFVKRHNAHGHLVVHPRKGYVDDGIPGKDDIGGTGHITNLAHNVLIMWRPTEELKKKAAAEGKKHWDCPDSRLYVRKNREWGTEGHVDFTFDPETKIFSEVF